MNEAQESTVDSYEIVLPPGWVQYPVRRGIAEKLYNHLRELLEPLGKPELVDKMRSIVYKAMRELRESGGIDLILPSEKQTGSAIPAALISNRIDIGAKGLEASLRLVARGRETTEVDTLVGTAYRWQSPTTGSGDLTGLDSGNTHYLFPLPGDAPTSAVMFTFSVLISEYVEDEYREILIVIFDAMMGSLIWTYSDEDA